MALRAPARFGQGLPTFGVGAHGGVVGEDATVHQHITIVRPGHQQRFEVGGRGAGGPGRHAHGHVIAGVLARPAATVEEGVPLLEVVGRHQHFHERLLQARLPEILREHPLDAVARILRRPQAHGIREPPPEAFVEDPRALLQVEAGQILGRVAGPAALPWHREPQGQDAPCAGACDQIEAVGNGPPGLPLQLPQHQSRDQAADATAIDGEDAEGFGHGAFYAMKNGP